MSRAIKFQKVFVFISICLTILISQNQIYGQTSTETPFVPKSKGYDIVIGIDEGATQPQNAVAYINSIQKIIQDFSTKLFATTQRRFFIQSVDLIIPYTWSIASINTTTSAYSMQTAHIRVSQRINSPRVENPNICGLPGNYIELPLTFFDSVNTGYRSPEKALLSLWARYRYGVWEEHGYAGSSLFPYFYETAEHNWEPVGCSNEEIQGEYLNLTKDVCEHDGDFSPGPECRFFPDLQNNIAISSLMSYPSVDSVVEFCDSSTHNKIAPNKQNIFCGHRSVLEVIQASPEYDSTSPEEEFLETAPLTELRIKKLASRPMLYILLDRGRTNVHHDLLTALKTNVSALFNYLTDDCVVGMGSFPPIVSTKLINDNGGGNGDGVSSIVNELIPWTSVLGNRENFKRILDDFEIEGPTERDFGLAIFDTINKIKTLKFSRGTVLLILKTGATSDFEKLHYEQEIISAAKEARIRIYGIELQKTAARPNINLARLVNQFNGIHLPIRSGIQISNIQTQIHGDIFQQIIRQPELPNTGTYRLIYKTTMDSNRKDLTLRLFSQDISSVHISFTTRFDISPSSILISYKDESFIPIREQEWNETTNGGTRFVYKTTIDISNDENTDADDELVFRITHSTDFSGLLVIDGKVVEPARANPYNIEITASSIPLKLNYLDNTLPKVLDGPFTISAKIERNRRPIKDLNSVQATIIEVGTGKSWIIDLFDDGFGTPDVYKDDGVYSGNFIPKFTSKLELRIFVIVKHEFIADGGETTRFGSEDNTYYYQPHNTRIHSDDQIYPGCSIGQCNAINSVENFTRVADLPYSMLVNAFSTEWDGMAVPARIATLKGWAGDDFTVHLKWISPIVYRITEETTGNIILNKVDKYIIFISDDIDELLNGRGEQFEFDKETSEPGEMENWTFDPSTKRISTKYFIGIRAVLNDINEIQGPLSNIVQVITKEEELLTTTPLPTTTTPEPTTIEVTQVTPSTPPPVTRPPTTTRRPTVTTERVTTEEPDKPKTWIQRPEGYWTVAGFCIGLIIICTSVAAYLYLRNKKPNGNGMNQRLVA